MALVLPSSRSGASLRAWYASSIDEFLRTSPDEVLGHLTRNSTFSVETTQRDAWLVEIRFLREQLHGLDGAVIFEFSIPRMGRRIDVVLLLGNVVFAVEFKVGATSVDPSALEQVWDYALDLKNFHEASHALPIVPIALATAAPERTRFVVEPDADGVCRPIAVTQNLFRSIVDEAAAGLASGTIDAQEWLASSYRPTPTIVEAARALYAQHSVEDIARYDAGAENLRLTSTRIEEIVVDAKARQRKAICFVTGVPGAGKTLVGLNVATRRREEHVSDPAVFLSGNAPLVAVLREALKRDERHRLKKKTGAGRLSSRSAESVKQFIQNVHHFRDEGVRDSKPPTEHVAVFDEAQRAWTRAELASWMKRKKGRNDWDVSEAEFLVSTMDRHHDWATIVCLVGGGQEIYRGEAGIDSWLDATRTAFPDWEMHISSKLTDSEYAAGRALDAVRSRPGTFFDDCLHLSVSMRSFRAENVSAFVKAVLDRDVAMARRTYEQLADRYPLVVTRDLDAAKEWVRNRARGSERFGLVASSKAMRLKPHAVDVRVKVDPVPWFLNDRNDVRSSDYLEDAATEFQVQGLELDWTCVTWDGDLRHRKGGWGFHDFKGSKWQNVNNADNQRYLLNAYRVLLTRARQGMVIFVPPGERRDATRPPEFYDGTFSFLRECGIGELR